jgi:hypothetical protein
MVMEYAGQRMMHDLRMRLYGHIQDLALEFSPATRGRAW